MKPTSVKRDRNLLNAARGQPCQWCGRNDRTIVAAHYNGSAGGKGMGMKASDHLVAWLCAVCHRECDQSPWLTGEQRQLLWRLAFERTCDRLDQMGLVTNEMRADWQDFMERV